MHLEVTQPRDIILLVFPCLCFSKSLLIKVFIILLPLTICLQPITHYLVKWRSQPYEESTWEIEVKFTKQLKLLEIKSSSRGFNWMVKLQDYFPILKRLSEWLKNSPQLILFCKNSCRANDCLQWFWEFVNLYRASDISRKKKIGRFRGIFAGEKSIFAEKSADFVGF